MTHDELRRAAARLRQFLARYGPYLGRKEVQILAETYVKGLLSDTRKRNAEAIAWEVGDGRVRALQRLLDSARWDEEGVVAEHQLAVAEHMGERSGIFVVDDTGFAKKGNCSCGVGRQYSGTLGRVDNCRIGVFLSYAVPGSSHTLIDRRLYLKEEWFSPEWDGLWPIFDTAKSYLRRPQEVTNGTAGVAPRAETGRREGPHPSAWRTTGGAAIPSAWNTFPVTPTNSVLSRYASFPSKTAPLGPTAPLSRCGL